MLDESPLINYINQLFYYFTNIVVILPKKNCETYNGRNLHFNR